ncbi:hypothetical protein [Pararhodonellum marinum]|uniref:hypothetical protein n=1 Tax=Pararhodonellum marinum TaxID=2755358 RepID=UPI00188ECF21|nr:hypothetical protein [Pararhodonellum marinum]
MKFNENDIGDFFEGELGEKEAKEFLIWLHSKEGERTYKRWIEKLWKHEIDKSEEIKEADFHMAIMELGFLINHKIVGLPYLRNKTGLSIKLLTDIDASFNLT